MSSKVDAAAAAQAEVDKFDLPSSINESQATVLFRKVETKHKLQAQANVQNQVEFKKLY